MFSRLIRIVMSKVMRQRLLCYVVANLKREYNHRIKYKDLTPNVSFCFASLWGIVRKKNEDQSSLTTRDILLAKADALFDQDNHIEIFKLLYLYKDSEDVEILWRLSRTLYSLSTLMQTESEIKKLVYQAYDLLSQALYLQEDHWAVHKWFAIVLNKKTSYEGTKKKIKELYNIKVHILRALELNPKDATMLYMMGSLCYQLADLAWYQRKIAWMFFAEPPMCAFEEALQYFEQAERVDPDISCDNLLMIGKTCLKLNKKDDALKYLKMASEYPAKNDTDQNAKQEALKLLNGL